MIGAIIGSIIGGAIIGAVARLAVPGKQDISLVKTIGLGIVGALIAGIIANLIGLGSILTWIVAVIVAAGALLFTVKQGWVRTA